MQTELKIKDRFNEPNFKDLIGLIFSKASLLSGIKNPMADFIKTDLKNLVFIAFKQLTIDEIHKAFEMERFGLYEQKTDHFQLFDTNYVSEILKKYVKWKQEFKDKHKITFETPPALPEFTECQKTQMMLNAVLDRFQKFKATNEIEIPFIHVFDFLVDKNFIKLSEGETTPKLETYYAQIRVQAMEQVQSDLLREKNTKTLSTTAFHTLKNEFKNAQEGNSNLVDLKVKEIVLKQFFNKHLQIENNTPNHFKTFIYGNGN